MTLAWISLAALVVVIVLSCTTTANPGILSIVFGVLVVAQPNAGALTLVYLFGFYAILAGIAQISFGMRVRGIADALQPKTRTATSASR